MAGFIWARRLGAAALVFVLCGVWPAHAGLIGYWRLEDGPIGTEATTLASEANSPLLDGTEGGTASGAMVFSDQVPDVVIVDPVTGAAAANTSSLFTKRVGNNRFDVDDNLNVPPLHEPDTFSCEMFIKAGDDVSQYRVLARKTRDSANGSWFLIAHAGRIGLRVDSNDDGKGQFNQGLYSSVAAHGSIDDGQWHHIAVTYDDTPATFKLYKDYSYIGQLVPGNGGSIVYDGGVLHLGGRNNGNGWEGWVDEIRFVDDVLTPEQFLQAIPEPATLSLLGIGLAALARRRRR
jgi:hypothetical protein